jgi:hypothetical protein
MTKITVLLALVGTIVAFAESANTRPRYNNYNYSSCVYRGYSCSQWTRPDSY